MDEKNVSGVKTSEALSLFSELLATSMDELASRFGSYDMRYVEVPDDPGESYFPWYGRDDEEIMVCVFRGRELHESFHRHDFFFFNYAYDGDYQTLSGDAETLRTIQEGELYLGQPYTGYALRGNSEREVTIVGVLIRKETFFNSFLPLASMNDDMVRFFIDPLRNPQNDDFAVLHPSFRFPIRELLQRMICEYSNEREDTQSMLKSYALQLVMHSARQFEYEYIKKRESGVVGEMLHYLESHVGQVSLGELAKRYSYHPNYLSGLLKKETGMTFSEIVLRHRMSRALIMLRSSSLSVEKIAYMLGYSDPSNFHRAFSTYFGCAPREYKFGQEREQ